MIDTGAGVIDADYRGIVSVLLFNLSDKDFEGKDCRVTCVEKTVDERKQLIVKEGDRIAQLILERIHTPDVFEVQVRRDSPHCSQS